MTMSFKPGIDVRAVELDVAQDFLLNTGAGRRSSLYRRGGKRLFDILFVVALMPIWVPMVALFALAVWMSGGKPFYWQERVGRDGRAFRMLKIRTMVQDADRILADYLRANPVAKAEWDTKQKLDHDPRITAVGRFLRQTSMDELPQLWNVLKGEMSVVGPRPMMPDQRPLYPGSAYYALRPGITGAWQVMGRNDCSFSDRARFDTAYHGELSLSGDISLLARTAGVVLRCTGR